MLKSIALILIGFATATIYFNFSTWNVVLPDDRSFYAEPDANAWPGDSLSQTQVNAAIAHFADDRGGWALIGPNHYLLKGTHYQVRDVYASPWIPNVHIVKGYWGDVETDMRVRSVTLMKLKAEGYAAKDRYAGVEP